jgi:ADP-heptose:LPS heptosyltransferase
MEKLLLTHRCAPGDIVVMTALIRDISLAYPNKYHIAVDTPFKELWDNNPHVKRMPDKKGARIVRLTYGDFIRKESQEKMHFLTSFHKDFKRKTGIEVPLVYPYPDLHLSESELEPIVKGRYWVVVAGGKNDFTTKHWVYDRYQQVVDALLHMGIHVVQLGGTGSRPSHYHPELKNVINLVGKTDLRQMLRVINGSDGVICTITSAMHMAAALGKPCVVTGAGREAWWWEAYHRDNPGLGSVSSLLHVNHRYLHTIGKLDCCATKGCWKNKVRSSEGDKSFCAYPVQAEKEQFVPLCMDMISTEKVVASVLSYYMDGTLSPVEGMMLPDVTKPVMFSKNGETYSLFVMRDNAPKRMSESLFDPSADFLKAKAAVKNIFASNAPPAVTNKPEFVENALKKPEPVPDSMNIGAKVAGTRLIDSDQVGKKITFFVLMYGNYPDMHKRCLEAIKSTTSKENVELRVYCNAVCPETMNLCRKLEAEGVISLIYESSENKFKYPCMRQMFHDPLNPITTKWVVWFDDDTMCDVDKLWFDKLCSTIMSSEIADPKVGAIGPIYHFALAPKHAKWVKDAKWYKGKMFRNVTNREASNGNRVFFVTGSFWAMKAEAIRTAMIPDERLLNNGGDVCIGEQLWQNGYTMKHWNGDKKTVCWSSSARRGASQSIFNI